MDLLLLRVFQRQVQLQCQALLVAGHDFNSAQTTGDMAHTWIAIQNILSAAANISKALWGQGGRLSAEREPLRVSLQVDDTSPLRDVVMRNHFEHYDERLDHWWKTSEAHNHLDMGVLAPGAIQGLADTDMFRVFDPTTAEIVFWGQRFNVGALVQEAARLLPIASAEGNQPHWEPSEPPSTSGSDQ
jgi:hypothetical protein